MLAIATGWKTIQVKKEKPLGERLSLLFYMSKIFMQNEPCAVYRARIFRPS